MRGVPVAGTMNGSGLGGTVPTSLSGQQLASAIPSPTAGKTWRSKSMNLKHSATSSMLASPTHSPSPTSSPQGPDGPHPHGGDGSKLASAGVGAPSQRSVLDKFRLINPRSASRASPSVAEMALQEEDDLSEYGEDGPAPPGSGCGGSSAAGKLTATKTHPSNGASSNKTSSTSFSKGSSNGGRSAASSKDKEDKSKGGKSSKDNCPPKEERDAYSESNKKSSKIASLIPKGGKTSSGKKDGAASSIPKPGLKGPSSSTAKGQAQNQAQTQAQSQALTSSANLRGGDGDRAKVTKGGQGGSLYTQRSGGTSEGKRTSMTLSTSTSALSGTGGVLGGGGGPALGGTGVVQLPQQQQHNHPNTATVAPFMYR